MREASYPQSALVQLYNGRFADVEHGTYFDPHIELLIKNGKIVAMPASARQSDEIRPDLKIDLQGKVVIPGLFNTHCHAQLSVPTPLSEWRDKKLIRRYQAKQIEKNMAECLEHGFTTIRDAGTLNLRANRRLRERIDKGDIPGPRLIQSVLVSPLGGAASPVQSFSNKLLLALAGLPFLAYDDPSSGTMVFAADAHPDEVRKTVDRAIDERGAECIKIYDQREKGFTYKPGATLMTLKQLEALTDQARRRGVQSTMHHVSLDSFRRGVVAGVSSLAHLPCDSCINANDVESFLKSGAIIEPTLSLAFGLCWPWPGDAYESHPHMQRVAAFRNTTYRDLIKEYWLTELQPSAIRGIEKANQALTKMFGIFDLSKIFRYYFGTITAGVESLQKLVDRGACVAFANDGGAVPPCTVAAMQIEAALFDEFMNSDDTPRINGAQMLRIATINSAKTLGLDSRLGTLETGKIADLVVIDGNPFQDIKLIGSRVAALFMDGELMINHCGLSIQSL